MEQTRASQRYIVLRPDQFDDNAVIETFEHSPAYNRDKRVADEVRNNVDLKTLRAQALYDYDRESKLRASHDTPAVEILYKEYFGEPNSHKAHELLHTVYSKREKY